MSHIRLLLVAALSVTVTLAASPSVGLAVANGTFQVDKSSVYGNATLFDGSLIETVAVSSDLVLRNGARLRLGSESQARIHADRLVLEKGQTEISASSGYSVEAFGLRVAPESLQSRFAVTYSGPARLQVAALLGSARVSGLNGVLIAAVPAGTALISIPRPPAPPLRPLSPARSSSRTASSCWPTKSPTLLTPSPVPVSILTPASAWRSPVPSIPPRRRPSAPLR